jgi:hypothetical protein
VWGKLVETGDSGGNPVLEIAFDKNVIGTAAKSAPCGAASFESELTSVVMGSTTGVFTAEIGFETGGTVGDAVPEIVLDNDVIRTAAKSAL